MKNEKEAIKFLQVAGEGIQPDQVHQVLVGARLKDESDRGAVLIGVSYLEYALEKLLRNAMPSPDDQLFKGSSAPLSSLASKIDVANAFGLISSNIARNLHLLRKVRNQVAHSWDRFDIEEPGVEDRIRATGFLNQSYSGKSIPVKEYFDFFVSHLITHIDFLARQVDPVPCVERGFIDFAVDQQADADEWYQKVIAVQNGDLPFPRCWHKKQASNSVESASQDAGSN